MNPSQRKQNQSSITKYFTPQPSENTSQENPSPENETPQDLNPSDETVDSQSSEDIKNSKIKNKGTGAGGANTNVNGLPYEKITELKEDERYKNKKKINIDGKEIQIVTIDNKEFIKLKQGDLKKYMKKLGEYTEKEKQLNPDECYLDDISKTIHIIEKKFQQTSGSVDEKIQTAIFKKEFYEEQYPNYKIKYCYCLSDWFKQSKYKPEMRYLMKYGFKVFWGKDTLYQNNILDWIVNNL